MGGSGVFIDYRSGRGFAQPVLEVLSLRSESLAESGSGALVISEGKISVRGLRFSYPGEDVKALQDVEFEVAPGSLTAIVGDVGSGKSTLLQLIRGTKATQEGQVLIDGQDIQKVSPESLNRHMVLLSAETTLPKDKTLREMLLLHRGSRPIAPEELRQVMERLGLEKLWERLDEKISDPDQAFTDGEKRLILLAQAHLGEVKVLLLDDFLRDLSPSETILLREAILQIREDKTVFLALSSPDDILRDDLVRNKQRKKQVEHIFVFKAGSLVAAGKYSSLVRSRRGLEFQRFWNGESSAEPVAAPAPEAIPEEDGMGGRPPHGDGGTRR